MEKKVRVKKANRKLVAFGSLKVGDIFWGLNMSGEVQMKKTTPAWAREYFGPASTNYSNWYAYNTGESVELE